MLQSLNNHIKRWNYTPFLKMSSLSLVFRLLIIGILKGYQMIISPLLGCRCRFYPSCSEYAKEALLKHGLINGIWLSIKRLLRCHPLCEGGIDLVPFIKQDKKVKL